MTVAENKFNKTELHMVLNSMGRAGLTAEEKDSVGKTLAVLKEQGVTINTKVIENIIFESRKTLDESTVNVSPIGRKSISSIG
jgi:hypothetical protein